MGKKIPQTSQNGSPPFSVEQQGQEEHSLPASFSQVLVEHAYDYKGLLQHVPDTITRWLGDACIIAMFSEQLDELRAVSVSHRSPLALKQLRVALKRDVFPIEHVGFAAPLLKGETCVVDHPTYEQACDLLPPELWPLAEKIRIKSLAGFPISAGQQVLAGLFVARERPASQPYSQKELADLQAIAALLGPMLQNARLFAELQDGSRQLRGLVQEVMESQEEKFQRLGKELHDHIGQDLTAISINISLIERMLPEQAPEGLQARLSDANHLVEESVARMRNVMAEFVPPMLDRYGLAAALIWYGQKITKRTRMPVNVDDSNLRNVRLPAQVEIVLFRIAQEALDNIAGHTQASRAEVELRDEKGFILMAISDNGAGFDPQAAPDGRWGLAMMRERARGIGAAIDIESTPGAGTRVSVRLPRKS